MRKTALFLIVSSLVLAALACSIPGNPAPPPTAQPSNALPDLTISQGTITMQGYQGGCIEAQKPLITSICIQNIGNAAANGFIVQAGDKMKMTISSLDPGETTCFDTEGAIAGTPITVDALNSVAESVENNNSFTIPMPTAPAICTPVSDSGNQQPTETQAATPAQPAPTNVPATQDTRLHVDFNGITFSADKSLASMISPSVVPAEASEDPWGTPEHIEFQFIDYPLHDTFHEPRIIILSVDKFKVMNPNVGKIIDNLKTLLASKPQNPESIPFLPLFNAAEFMQAQVHYFNFQNGSGVRFVTQFGQAAWPINNNDMFYTYQGITNDGKYYISAILPVSHPSLPDPNTVSMDEAFINNYMTYVAQVEIDLNAQPPESFNPSLTIFDEMLQTFNITPP